MIIGLILVYLLPAGLLSLALAFVPWRPLVLRTVLLSAQILACIVLTIMLPGPWLIWAHTLGPGAICAALRAAAAGVELARLRATHQDSPG